VTGARHPRLQSFLNFLLWYLGTMFLFFGLLVVGILLLPRLSSLRPWAGYGIIVGNVILVTIVAIRCKAGFWSAVAACVIGFAAMALYLVIPTLVLIYITRAKLVDGSTAMTAFDQFGEVGCFVIGVALLLNRWFARRRRIAAEAATTAAVFD
jgi:hypothetical protein